jgi:hypothetical protein
MSVAKKIKATGWRLLCCMPLLAGAYAFPAQAQVAEIKAQVAEIKWYGDFRIRLETDQDYKNTDGNDTNNDRTRLRIRGRLGAKYVYQENIEFGFRLRTGSEKSHQSPHITIVDFDDNDTGDSDLNFDKYYMKGTYNDFSGWVGRNSHPFWRQDEFFWDDDVTPLGVAGSYKTTLGKQKLEVNSGYFSMPSGMVNTAGNLYGAQGVWGSSLGDNTSFTLAAGYFVYDALGDLDKFVAGDDAESRLADGNDLRDYETTVLNGQLKFKLGVPFTIGVDYYSNGESYSDADLIASGAPAGVSKNDDDGYSAIIKAKVAKDWELAYAYADIDFLAYNGSYGEDDWVRWGGKSPDGESIEASSTNIKGHEGRVKYTIDDRSNLVLRVYFVETKSNKQEGNRARVDYNWKF